MPTPEAIAALCAQLASGKQVRRGLEMGGRLHVDRPLPFLVVHRLRSPEDSEGTPELVTTQPAYLIANCEGSKRAPINRLIGALVAAMRAKFGAFMLVEIGAAEPDTGIEDPEAADIRIATDGSQMAMQAAEMLARRLPAIKLQGRAVRAAIVDNPSTLTLGRPLLTKQQAAELGCCQVAIEVRPLFRVGDGTIYPSVMRALRSGIARALARTFYQFADKHTEALPHDFQSLGRRAMVRAVWQVDERLADVSSSFDFLLNINPIGVDGLWSAFRKSGFEAIPSLRYAPLPIDPILIKRRLFAVPLERIEDPTLSTLFYEKQIELDRKLSMLMDRASPRFLQGSVQLFGPVHPALLRAAEEILERVPANARGAKSGGFVRADELLERANEELAYYRGKWSDFSAVASISPDVLAGMMVSGGKLLVAAGTRTPSSRVDALLQHEVGTHLVTYFNGKAQRLAHLRVGFAGYDELQEGLAVLAEYLAGGMTPARLRVLAARVIAARMITDGATFVDTFRALCRFGFTQRASFNITLRIYRGGGFTKDLIYLRGLRRLLKHLSKGGEIEPLLIGKIGLGHVPLVDELRSRGVVSPPVVLPRYFERKEAMGRLERLRQDTSLFDLVSRDPKPGDRPTA